MGRSDEGSLEIWSRSTEQRHQISKRQRQMPNSAGYNYNILQETGTRLMVFLRVGSATAEDKDIY
jgi:hypothetical protein